MKFKFDKKPAEKIVLEDVSSEEKEKIDAAEKKAEELYALRMDFWRSWQEQQRFFKPIKRENGKMRKIRINDILNIDEKEWEKFLDEGAILQEVREKVRGKEMFKPGSQKEKVAIKAKKAQVIASLGRVVELRKKITGEGELEPTFSAEDRAMYEFRISERRGALVKLDQLAAAMAAKLWERNFANAAGEYEAAEKAAEDYSKMKAERDKLIADNPEAFLYVASEKIRNMKKAFDAHGKIVETPYVREMMERVWEILNDNRPVFIHGELGSGKTEFAKHLSRTTLSREYLQRWEKGDPEIGLKPHPKPGEAKAPWRKEKRKPTVEELAQWQREHEAIVEGLAQWKKERETTAEPYVISGHRGLEPEQFLGGIKITRVEQMKPSERVAHIRGEVEKYRREYPEASDKEIAMLEESWQKFFDSPVETIGYLGKFYRAMYEGRTIIIDEINAIPHHVLILLNDLLTAKPGDIINPMIDDLPSFKVKEGFRVIATGNWRPGEDKLYVGRQPLDAAFLSRFALEAYSYLPNGIEFTSMQELGIGAAPEEVEEQRQARQSNELFQMLLVRLMDRYGGLAIPEGETEKLFKLSMMAKVIQNIFSGEEVNKAIYGPQGWAADIDPKDLLKENVLSLRGLIAIIEEWKQQGFSRDLDDFIFLEYVSRSRQRPDEMKYLYGLLQTQGGFFPKEKGWPDSSTKEGAQALLKFNIIQRVYGVDKLTGDKKPETLKQEGRPAVKRYTQIKAIELMFGQPPKRKYVRRTEKAETPVDDVETVLIKQELDSLISENDELDKRLEGLEDEEEGGKDKGKLEDLDVDDLGQTAAKKSKK